MRGIIATLLAIGGFFWCSWLNAALPHSAWWAFPTYATTTLTIFISAVVVACSSAANKPYQRRHIWKVESEHNLGTYLHYGTDVHDICTMYRIAVRERCLVTGETRIRERADHFPAVESDNITATQANNKDKS